MQCVSITQKGLRCKKETFINDKCFYHAIGKIYGR